MLNNLTNFFNLIKGRKIKSVPDDTDLIALGTKDPRFDGGYQPTAISVADFIASLPSPPVIVDGTTITGNGTIGAPLKSNLGYSNVIFVDAVNGNDATGLAGNGSRPFLTVNAALTAAAALSPSSSSKVLIYIRRGAYVGVGSVYMINYADMYCEPGVLFQGNTIIRDTSPGVVANFYGYAAFENSQYNVLEVDYASTMTFEFTTIITTGRAIGLQPAGGTATVVIKGDIMYSSTFGTAHGNTIRGNVNLFMNVSRSIEAVHTVFEFRNNHSGTVVINCPKIYLGTGNIYGANSKQAVLLSSGLGTSEITINADLVNKDTTGYIGGAQGLLSIYGSYAGKFRLNGNIIAGPQLAFHGNNTVSGFCTVNGDTSSTWDYGIWAYGSGRFRFIDGTHALYSSTYSSLANFAINGTAITYFYNCNFVNGVTNKDNIVINSVGCYTYLTHCTGNVKSGGTGYSVSTSAGGGNIAIHSSRFNLGLNPALTDLYSPTGLVVDTNVSVLDFIA